MLGSVRFYLLAFALATASIAPPAATAAEPRRVLADFEGVTPQIKPRQATAKPRDLHGSPALEVTTEVAPYPGVDLRPAEGTWDLSAYDGVGFTLHNPTDEKLRLLAAASDPKDDGRTHTSVVSAELAPGQTERVFVAFGAWHGQTDVPIDKDKIAAVVVFLDTPDEPKTFVVDGIAAQTIDGAGLGDIEHSAFLSQLTPPFGRGVNLGNALDAPNEGEWGVTLREEYFDLIKQAGFDSVRIPIRWSNHAMKNAPYSIDEEFAKRVDWVVDNCLKRNLEPLINVHHYGELMADPDGHADRFIALWRQIAERYADSPASLKFELLNEPQDKLTPERWNDLLARTLPVVRESNPDRKIVIGPGFYNNISKLNELELPKDDRNLIVTFHYYSPHHFTHQGAEWSGPESQEWLGTTWTGTPAERAAVVQDLNKAVRWADEHKRPLYMGEFGAYSKADMKSRAAWTEYLAEQAIARKIGFAYWEFCSGFGVYDPQAEEWVEPLKAALLSGEDGE